MSTDCGKVRYLMALLLVDPEETVFVGMSGKFHDDPRKCHPYEHRPDADMFCADVVRQLGLDENGNVKRLRDVATVYVLPQGQYAIRLKQFSRKL